MVGLLAGAIAAISSTTGALVTSLEKNLLSRIEDPALDVAGEVLGRSAQAGLRSFRCFWP